MAFCQAAISGALRLFRRSLPARQGGICYNRLAFQRPGAILPCTMFCRWLQGRGPEQEHMAHEILNPQARAGQPGEQGAEDAVIVGTRGSALALWQTEAVIGLL